MKSFAILPLWILSVKILISNCITFDYELSAKSMQCFGESLADGVLVVGEFKTYEDDQDLNIRIIDDKGEVFQEFNAEAHQKFSFSTFEGGNYQICATNIGENLLKMTVEIKIGAEAKDFTTYAMKQEVKSLEMQTKMLHEILKNIQQELKFIVIREDEKLGEADTMSTKLTFYSVVTVVIIVVLAFLQIKYLKYFFKKIKML